MVLAAPALAGLTIRQQVHKNGSGGGFCCFCCFGRKLSAQYFAFSAEILARPLFNDHQNSEIFRCFAAVFRCYE
jgi:hypothetical protein